MSFGLTIGTERASALQQAIQDKLIKCDYSVEAVRIRTTLAYPNPQLKRPYRPSNG